MMINKVKILLINAIDISKPTQTMLPPLGLGYLASSLRSEFGSEMFEFKIIDRDVENQIRIFKPNIVGISCVSLNFNYAKEYAKMAKKKKIPVIIGGIHISIMPKTMTRDMDVAVIGEGEEAIKELFSIYQSKKMFDKNDLSGIKGVAFWKGKKVVQTEIRPPVRDMDKILMPARDLMKIDKCTHVFSSRGCPYRCVFCASSRFWKSTRFFSAKYVVAEIKHLYDTYGVREVDFWDDLFIVSKPRIKEMIKLMRKEKLLGKVSFFCAVRSNLIDESMAKLLKKLNIKGVSMGLESATPRILNYLKGDTINIGNHKKAIRILKKHGLETSASFIIGTPDETREEILETLKFIKESKLRGITISVLTPLPGTPIWDYAEKRGLVSERMDWSRLNMDFVENYKEAIVLSEKLSREELFQLVTIFMNERRFRQFVDYLRHPVMILRVIYHQIKKIVSPIFSPLLLRNK